MPDICRECSRKAILGMSVCGYHKRYERNRSTKRRAIQKELGKCNYLSCDNIPLVDRKRCQVHTDLYKRYSKQARKRKALRNMFARQFAMCLLAT